MLAATLRRSRMTRPSAAVARTRAVAAHFMSSQASAASAPPPAEDPVLFESNLGVRKYVLNRTRQLNALNEPMIDLLRARLEEWNESRMCSMVVGTGLGKAFCSGGDVKTVMKYAEDEATRPKAIQFFKKEFELDFLLATMPKPYIAVLDGITMGGGVGLAINAPFRIATENTRFSMPETKIGYSPDVSATYFLPRLDGQIGTYLGLTSREVTGRAVFEHGLATHFIPSRRLPALLDRLASLDDPSPALINSTIEEHSMERGADEPPAPFTGAVRVALDHAFAANTVEEIMERVTAQTTHEDPVVAHWAQETLSALQERSPTSLKVALIALRNGAKMSLLDALNMEFRIATAICNGAAPDFKTGVTAVLVEKSKTRPSWTPATLEGVTNEMVSKFFAKTPELDIPALMRYERPDAMRFALPTEAAIGQVVVGSHATSAQFAVTSGQLLERFETLSGSKAGVRDKVLEVVRRRCRTERDAEGKEWLVWRH